MQLFIVKGDGEVHEILEEKQFRELLSPNECYITSDDRTRKIYLWKGSKCSVRSKFIGASMSQQLRGQVGMHYTVTPIDEGDEPKEFIALLDEIPTRGHAKSIIAENDVQFEIASKDLNTEKEPAGLPNFGGGTPEKAKQVMSSGGNETQGGPLYTGGSFNSGQSNVDATPTVDFQKIMESLEALEIPEGYFREMIIIGNQAYSIVEKKVNFLGNEKIEKSMEKIGSLPEGVFFAQGYTPRVLCENQKVLAIEFLKKKANLTNQKKLKADVRDPKALAKQFGMNV